MMTARGWVCAAAVAVALLTAGCRGIDLHAAGLEGTFERTLTVSGPVDLDVRTGSGDIEIRVGTDTTVRVVGHIRAGASWGDSKPEERVSQIQANPPIEQNGNAIRIGNTADNPLYRNVSISYEVVVPPHTRLQSRSGSGAQKIASLQGPIDAQAGSGDIDIAKTDSSVQASTGSGDINILSAGGSLSARTGSGDIHAGAVAGAVNASTGSGDVAVIQTGRGNVEIRTASGDVTIGLPGDAAFSLDAHSASGSIHTTHPLAAGGSSSRHRLQGTVRGGGQQVDITTASGSILVR